MRKCLPFRSFSQRIRPALRWTNLGARRGFQQSDRKQLASIPKRTVSLREGAACGLQRGSSGHQFQPAWNTAVSSAKRTVDHNVEAGAGEMVIEGSANLKRTVLGENRTCWAHRGTQRTPAAWRYARRSSGKFDGPSSVKRMICFVDRYLFRPCAFKFVSQ